MFQSLPGGILKQNGLTPYLLIIDMKSKLYAFWIKEQTEHVSDESFVVVLFGNSPHIDVYKWPSNAS